jgi:ferrous iron transport protein A
MENLVSLDTLDPKKKGFLRSLEGGGGFVSRLAALGFTPGAPILVIQNRGRGPMIVLVRECRIALGRGEARKVWVQAEENGHGLAAG